MNSIKIRMKKKAVLNCRTTWEELFAKTGLYRNAV
jgi:hypothetical protein